MRLSSKFTSILFACILSLILFIAPVFSAEDDRGCCLNPKVADIYSNVYCSGQIQQKNCCPVQTSYTAPYYRDSLLPYGPSNQAECISTYFKNGQSCSVFSDACTLSCCCDSPYKNFTERIPVARCTALSGTPRLGDQCETVCNATDPTPNTDQCDGANNPRIILRATPDNRILPVQGERAITLYWDISPCRAQKYTIIRRHNNIIDFTKETTDMNFTDSDNLMWNQEYEYLVKAAYPGATGGEISTTIWYKANLGDIECWGKKDSSLFCMYPGFFNGNIYRDYFSSSYESEIQNRAGKIGGAYSCDAANRLSVGQFCPQSKVCHVREDNLECLEPTNCEPEDYLVSPFGLYFTRNDCHDLGFCYFDTSPTLVDKCYSCITKYSTLVSCYDYKSESACNEDNCGIGYCRWRSINSRLGIGACVDITKDNCYWCNKRGTEGTDTVSFNSILDVCTPTKAEALSTDRYSCYYTMGEAKSCGSLTCMDFIAGSDRCPSTIPELYNNNSIKRQLQSKCDIGICQNISSKCRKNADNNDKPDCADGNLSCERDVFPPETSLLPNDEDGYVTGYTISIQDRMSDSINYNPYGYKIYLCVDNSTTNDCLQTNSNGYPFNIIHSMNNALKINGLRLSEVTNDRSITMLSEGINKIYYFARDSSNNLGLVKSVELLASVSNTMPDIYRVEITGAMKVGSVYYTNSKSPIVKLYFSQGGEANLTQATLYNEDLSTNPIVVSSSEYSIVSYPEGVSDFLKNTYTLTQASTKELAEGTYRLNLLALNEKGWGLRRSQRDIIIKVNYSLAQATITPPPPAFINSTSLIDLKISFPREVVLSSVRITDDVGLSSVELVDKFLQAYPEPVSNYMLRINFSDGTKVITVKGTDYYGNQASGTARFVINSLRPDETSVRLYYPRYGVSPTQVFNLTLHSDNELTCRYGPLDINPLSFGGSPLDIFNRMSRFDLTNSSLHKKNNFAISDERWHKLYVWCIDYYYYRSDPYKYAFDIKVDTTPPVISVHTFPASPIAEIPSTVRFTATSSEAIQCKYSTTNKPYKDMEINFGDTLSEPKEGTYKQDTFVNYTQNGKYTYYVACENAAGLVSDTFILPVEVNSNVLFEITDMTEPYQGSKNPTIAISTNKVALCSYSITEGGLSSPLNPQGDSFIHTAIWTNINLSSSTYTIYVACTASNTGETATKTVIFTIDLTAPHMQYVNDTSLDQKKPEFTMFDDRIYARWYAADNETGHKGLSYNYSIIKSSSREMVVNWTSGNYLNYYENKFSGWLNQDNKGESLNLTNNTKYLIRVTSGNIVNLWGNVTDSDGVTTDFSLQFANNTCTNNKYDSSTESDVDCGRLCPVCDAGSKCRENSDCESNYCNSDHECEEALCDDEIENGDETDVDCGGDDCDECPDGESCKSDSDCESKNCKYNTCSKPNSCSDNKLSSGESDIDCGGICPARCKNGQYCTTTSDCVSGISCIGGKCKEEIKPISDSDGDGMPDDWEEEHGLNPNDASDAEEDLDQDGFTNLEEYMEGTDPTDPDSKPDSGDSGLGFGTIMLILLIILVLAAIGYLVYTQYFNKKPKVMPFKPQPFTPFGGMPQTYHKPGAPVNPQLMVRLKEDKLKKRTTAFDAFGPSQKEEKPTEKKEEAKDTAKDASSKPISQGDGKEYIDITELSAKDKKDKKQELKQPSSDVFNKLSGIIGAKKKEDTQINDESTLKKLSKLSKEASTEVKKDLSQHTKKLDTRLNTIEKKIGGLTKQGPFYATKSGTKYHKGDCITLKDIPKSELKKFDNEKEAQKKLKPCSVCLPDKK